MPNNVFSCQHHQKRPKNVKIWRTCQTPFFHAKPLSKRPNFWNLSLKCQPGNPQRIKRTRSQVRVFSRNQKLCFAVCTYQHMIIAAGLTLLAKSCTLGGSFLLPGLADYPLQSGCTKNTLWVVAPCSMNMSQQYFGENNWGFSFSMQFFEAVQL